MTVEKIDLSKFRNEKVLIIFDLDRVAREEFVSLHKENILGKDLKALNINDSLQNTSIMYGVLEQMVIRPVATTDYLFATDTREGFSSWLYKRFEHGGLPDPESEFYHQLNWLRYLLKEMNYNVMEQDGYEAYNFIYKAVYENYDAYDKIYIFSEDKVLFPLVDRKVSVLSTQKIKPDVTLSSYETILGVPYNLLQLHQCTVGDIGFDLKGVHRFGNKRFETMLNKDDIFDKPLSTSTEELIKESVYLNEEQKQQALDSLEWLLPRDGIEVDTRPMKINNVDLKSLLDKLEFYDLLEKAEKL